MHYHLCDHIYVTQFREELILLDTRTDKYTICFKAFSELLNGFLERSHCDSKYSQQELTYIQKLFADDIIEKKDSPYPFYIDKKPQSDGVANVDWRLPLDNKKIGLSIQVLKAFLTIIQVNYYIKFRGLYSMIQLIKRSPKKDSDYIIPQDDELRDLANVINKACLLYPTRTKCLEWAMTFVLLALKRKWKCNLEIGVQNYPFMAHAWVECGGKVIMDSQNLRDGLAIILNEPFRKVTI